MGDLTHGERKRQGLTCPPDSAPAPAEVLPRGPSEVEEEEEEERRRRKRRRRKTEKQNKKK